MIPFRRKYFWTLASGLTLLIGLAASPSFAETVIVKDISPGYNAEGDPNSSEPAYLTKYITEYNGQLFFAAHGIDEEGQPVGKELWAWNGTEATTQDLPERVMRGGFQKVP